MEIENKTQEQQTQNQLKANNLPNLGKHVLLDFVDTHTVDVNNYTQVHEVLSGALEKAGITIYNHSHKIFEPQGLSELFLLDHGHLTIHTWPESHSCAIDFYYSLEDNWEVVKKVEEYLCDQFGWEACTSQIVVPRGKMTKLQTNDSSIKSEIFNQVNFVHREKSQYQDIRIYDTQHLGRILTLDGYVQITDELEDQYTIDMVEKVISKDQECNHILIVGGGDLLCANYILNHFPKVKDITVCEMDGRVIECVKKYFKYGETVKNAEEKVHIVLSDGASFIKQKAEEKTQKYDAIIVDCSDTWDETSPAYTLTTVEFYKNIKSLLNEGCKAIQQLSDNDKIEGFKAKFTEAGFKDQEIHHCITPQYGEDLPLGIITNNNQ